MAKATSEPRKTAEAEKEKPICGLIMPIGGMPGYDVGHWSEVRTVLDRAILGAEMRPQPVWEGGVADIIHDRIVSNLFENPVIVCDVSGLNPNVMLELGMRLSFAKPTIIVTDDIDVLPFDTKIIEHLSYPKDLHLLKTERFIADLSTKVMEVMQADEAETYRPFIKNFGRISPGSLGSDRQPADLILDRLDRLSAELRGLRRDQAGSSSTEAASLTYVMYISVPASESAIALTAIRNVTGVQYVRLEGGAADTIRVQLRPDILWKPVESKVLSALSANSIGYVVVSAGLEVPL